METAPKNQLILLLIPKFDVHQMSWWVGCWSFVYQKWVVKTPYSINQKIVVCTDIPRPIKWVPLPQMHNQSLDSTTKNPGGSA